MPSRLVIVHGAYGAPDTNWFPWLADEARALGAEALLPRFPTPEGQDLARWLDVFDREAAGPGSDTIVLGFSIGSALAVQLAHRSAIPFKACVLVSGFWGRIGIDQYDQINASFFTPIDWARAKAGARDWLCFAGSDDPYIPEPLSLELASHVGARRIVVEGGKHLDAPSAGMTRFDVLLGHLTTLLRP